jgi:hypothetical protein
MVAYLFIVDQEKPELREYFSGWFSGIGHVEVIVDRRRGERRRNGRATGQERRRSDRRSKPEIDREIRETGFTIVDRNSR